MSKYMKLLNKIQDEKENKIVTPSPATPPSSSSSSRDFMLLLIKPLIIVCICLTIAVLSHLYVVSLGVAGTKSQLQSIETAINEQQKQIGILTEQVNQLSQRAAGHAKQTNAALAQMGRNLQEKVQQFSDSQEKRLKRVAVDSARSQILVNELKTKYQQLKKQMEGLSQKISNLELTASR